jgi:hypothetical protein
MMYGMEKETILQALKDKLLRLMPESGRYATAIGRNAGSVQDAKSIIAEIRTAVEKLEAVCANRPANNGGD